MKVLEVYVINALLQLSFFVFSDCQYTCHHQCLPLIQLECKSVSHDSQEDEGAVLSGETNLSDLSISNQSTEPLSEPATVSVKKNAIR